MHNLLHNDSVIDQVRCGTDGTLLRVGVNDYRSDERDSCQIFTSTSTERLGPHSMFDLTPLSEGAFALRSLANDRFVKVVPPPADAPSLPWKLVIGGGLIGAAESFRLSEDGKLFSALMGKHFDFIFRFSFFLSHHLSLSLDFPITIRS